MKDDRHRRRDARECAPRPRFLPAAEKARPLEFDYSRLSRGIRIRRAAISLLGIPEILKVIEYLRYTGNDRRVSTREAPLFGWLDRCLNILCSKPSALLSNYICVAHEKISETVVL